MSLRALAGSTAICAFLYLAWLGWSDVLFDAPSTPPESSTASSPVDHTDAAPRAPSARLELQAPATPQVSTTAQPPAERPPTTTPSQPESSVSTALQAEGQTAESTSRHAELPPVTDAHPGPPVDDPETPSEKPRPELGLGGRVLDREGAAVAGLPVEARPTRVFATGDTASAVAVPTRLRTVTDGAGRFEFARVVDGEYTVRTAETEIYEMATAAWRAGADSGVLVVKAKTGRTVHIHGVVVGKNGAPLLGVRAEVIGQPNLTSLSNDSGGYGLRVPLSGQEQDVALRFFRRDYRERRVTIGAAEAAAGEVARDVSLEPAGPAGRVSGLVTGGDGSPVPRASVQLLSTRRASRYQAVSDEAGRFALAGVEESDDYRLWVRPVAGYRDHVRDGLHIGPQGASFDVVVDALGMASLSGSMVDSEGRPLPGFTLWLSAAYGQVARALPVTGDAQGRFEVKDLPEGPVTFATRAAPQLSVSGLQLEAGVPHDVRLVLGMGPHRLEGLLVDERGVPIGGGRLVLLGSRRDGVVESRSVRETTTDAQGHFVLTQLGSGTHTLNVTAAGFRGARLQPQIGSPPSPLRIELGAVQSSSLP